MAMATKPEQEKAKSASLVPSPSPISPSTLTHHQAPSADSPPYARPIRSPTRTIVSSPFWELDRRSASHWIRAEGGKMAITVEPVCEGVRARAAERVSLVVLQSAGCRGKEEAKRAARGGTHLHKRNIPSLDLSSLAPPDSRSSSRSSLPTSLRQRRRRP